MKINFDHTNGELICPKCKGNHLHHEEVTVYERHDEDSSTGSITSSELGKLFNVPMDKNPSKRRNGLTIRFRCEFCSADPELAIIQHKGCTYIHWTSYRQDV